MRFQFLMYKCFAKLISSLFVSQPGFRPFVESIFSKRKDHIT